MPLSPTASSTSIKLEYTIPTKGASGPKTIPNNNDTATTSNKTSVTCFK